MVQRDDVLFSNTKMSLKYKTFLITSSFSALTREVFFQSTKKLCLIYRVVILQPKLLYILYGLMANLIKTHFQYFH